jgi:hypothetical protein
VPTRGPALTEVAQLEARVLVIPGEFARQGQKSSLQQPVGSESLR